MANTQNPRPTSSRPSSRLPTSRKLSLSGPHYSPRYEVREYAERLRSAVGIGMDKMTDWDATALQALEGKDVKDLLSNVGSGGGAAAPAAGGAGAAAGGAAAEETKEEAKEEGEFPSACRARWCVCVANNLLQRRRSRTRTWVSVSSTKRASTWARRGFDSSDSLCSSRTCMDLRRHLAHTTTGMEALIWGILVHRRSFTWNLKMRF